MREWLLSQSHSHRTRSVALPGSSSNDRHRKRGWMPEAPLSSFVHLPNASSSEKLVHQPTTGGKKVILWVSQRRRSTSALRDESTAVIWVLKASADMWRLKIRVFVCVCELGWRPEATQCSSYRKPEVTKLAIRQTVHYIIVPGRCRRSVTLRDC